MHDDHVVQFTDLADAEDNRAGSQICYLWFGESLCKRLERSARARGVVFFFIDRVAD